MKKIIFLIVFTLFCTITFSGCDKLLALIEGEPRQITPTVEKKFSLDLSDAEIIEQWDTHGGFHGDGTALLELKMPDGFEDNVKNLEGWKPTPLDDDTRSFIYNFCRLYDQENDKYIIPISDGYWYYEDTGPMNWIYAYYNTNNNHLYYYEYDA